MEIRFTSSVIEAIEFVLRLLSGHLTAIPKGAQFETPAEMTEKYVPLRAPVWCNFDFFSRIVPRPIQRTERVEPTADTLGSWMLERKVEFYHAGRLVALVTLVGQKIDKSGTKVDNEAFWGVSSISYCMVSGSGSDPSLGWTTFHRELVGLNSRYVG
jgi:hypothetical protein